jgi:hypothetical protein
VAQLVATGAIKSTPAENYGRINAANLKRAQALVESGKAVAGRLVAPDELLVAIDLIAARARSMWAAGRN